LLRSQDSWEVGLNCGFRALGVLAFDFRDPFRDRGVNRLCALVFHGNWEPVEGGSLSEQSSVSYPYLFGCGWHFNVMVEGRKKGCSIGERTTKIWKEASLCRMLLF